MKSILILALLFNRRGNKVWVKEGTDLAWDGKVNTNALVIGHSKLPTGTYFYTFEFMASSKKALTGFIVMQY